LSDQPAQPQHATPGEHLAQPYEEMFERNVGHAAKRGREVEIWVEGIPESKVGFLAGLDEEYIQVCLTKNQTLSNVRRDMIASMDETGNTIGSYIKEGVDPDVVRRIKEKVEHFQKRASYLYGKPNA